MGDQGGFDPCECIWGHEMAMRRLLSLLRQSQAYCTDNECFQNIGGSQNQNIEGTFLLICSVMFALAMYYMRPRSQRNFMLEEISKPGNGSGGNNNGAPPTPPPTAS